MHGLLLCHYGETFLIYYIIYSIGCIFQERSLDKHNPLLSCKPAKINEFEYEYDARKARIQFSSALYITCTSYLARGSTQPGHS